jgi:hypothetical protein
LNDSNDDGGAGDGTAGAGDGTAGAGAAPAAPGPANPDTISAVQTALGAEYAAVWCYTLVTAFLANQLQSTAQHDLDLHRARRDATIRLLADNRVAPAVAEPAYRTPAPVTDSNSAIRLVLSAENDAASAWHSVIERCDDPGLRRIAQDGLTEAATLGARWSVQLNNNPAVPPFPGRS